MSSNRYTYTFMLDQLNMVFFTNINSLFLIFIIFIMSVLVSSISKWSSHYFHLLSLIFDCWQKLLHYFPLHWESKTDKRFSCAMSHEHFPNRLTKKEILLLSFQKCETKNEWFVHCTPPPPTHSRDVWYINWLVVIFFFKRYLLFFR